MRGNFLQGHRKLFVGVESLKGIVDGIAPPESKRGARGLRAFRPISY
ncbi:hypothetical protein SAMN04488483_4462 [Pseudomonas helmanticensis]|uniref:Uncharacterized protein n=1 Tax=Pseudomonas helmanticensis TaxID=1471381 RepID=A0ACD2UBC1_9PSED|nr:hypothetical protein SAMN04488483_4462 [Pseudomonas helmanticensis]